MSVQAINTDWMSSISESNKAQNASWLSNLTSSSKTSSASKAKGVDFASILKSKLDADEDGTVSQSEMINGASNVKSTLAQLNGMSSQMRAYNTQNPTATASSIISQIDSNGDGQLDITETKLSQTDFAKIDINGDGKITADELSSAISKSQGSTSASKLKASQGDCSGILAQLENTCSTRQLETVTNAENAA